MYRTFALYEEKKEFNILQGRIPDFATCSLENAQEWAFEYTGQEQEFTVPCTGKYKIELWGAISGQDLPDAISGAYTSGEIELKKGKTYYLYIGGKGNIYNTSTNGGYNGGGGSTKNDAQASGSTGGGATDIRLVNGEWSNFESLKSRIMVAAGNGMYHGYYPTFSGRAGGLEGYPGLSNSISLNWDVKYQNAGFGGTQITGGNAPSQYSKYVTNGTSGLFGIGGIGGRNDNTSKPSNPVGGGTGGGGGYYGGSGASGTTNGNVPSGGGSSFISGHLGCNAIAENSTSDNIIHTGEPIHYSHMVFTNTVMIDAAGYKWTDVREDFVGIPEHEKSDGNGYAKITYVG